MPTKLLTDAIMNSWFYKESKTISRRSTYDVKIVKLNLSKSNKVIKNTFR